MQSVNPHSISGSHRISPRGRDDQHDPVQTAQKVKGAMICYLVVSTPMKKKVSWDDYSQCMGNVQKEKKTKPNHQPV